MDRVWQLETEAFENAEGIECVSIFDVVETTDDPTAPNPEVQRQIAKCRTDMDCFSDLEISTLVQHGYCAASKRFRNDIDFVRVEIPNGPPWDPLDPAEAHNHLAPPVRSRLSEENVALRVARELQHSSKRRIWSTLVSARDWPSYIWLALILCLVVGVPYSLFNMQQTARRQQMVIEAITDIRPQYRKILELMKSGPITQVDALTYNNVTTMDPPDFTGFEVLLDSRIFDLRRWGSGTDQYPPSSHTHLRVQRKPESANNTHLLLQHTTTAEKVSIACTTRSLNPTLSRMQSAEGIYLWELDLDFSSVPVSSQALVTIESILPDDLATETPQGGRFFFEVDSPTDVLEVWLLMPEGRGYDSFNVLGFSAEKPDLPETVVPHTIAELPYGSVVTFRVFNAKSYRYECHWTWEDATD